MPRELEGSLDVDKSMPPKAQNHLGSRSRFKCDNFSPLTMAIVCLLVLGLYVAGHLLPRRFGRKGLLYA
jgi:hypothetical protein